MTPEQGNLMLRHPFVLAAIPAVAAAASAQNVATWFWRVSDTGDADGVIELGESALVTLAVGFDPPQPQEGGGFAAAYYDIIGDDGWAQGTVIIYENFLCPFNCGNLQGNNDVFDILNSQLPSAGNDDFNADNPIDLFFFEWKPDNYDGQTVTLDNGGPDVDIYTDPRGSSMPYVGTGGSVTFRVAPSPGAGAVAMAVGVVAATRRRRA